MLFTAIRLVPIACTRVRQSHCWRVCDYSSSSGGGSNRCRCRCFCSSVDTCVHKRHSRKIFCLEMNERRCRRLHDDAQFSTFIRRFFWNRKVFFFLISFSFLCYYYFSFFSLCYNKNTSEFFNFFSLRFHLELWIWKEEYRPFFLKQYYNKMINNLTFVTWCELLIDPKMRFTDRVFRARSGSSTYAGPVV